MPSGKTHLVVATAASTALTCGLGWPIEYVLAGTFAGILPDSDTRKSTIGGFVPLWLITKHRGFTHSYVALALFSLGTYLLLDSLELTLSFMVGYWSHLVLDWTTPMGIPWKWPKKKRYSLRRWK